MFGSVLFGSGYPEENGNTTENTVFADGRTCIHSFFCANFWNFGFGEAPWHGASIRDGHVVRYFSSGLFDSRNSVRGIDLPQVGVFWVWADELMFTIDI